MGGGGQSLHRRRPRPWGRWRWCMPWPWWPSMSKGLACKHIVCQLGAALHACGACSGVCTSWPPRATGQSCNDACMGEVSIAQPCLSTCLSQTGHTDCLRVTPPRQPSSARCGSLRKPAPARAATTRDASPLPLPPPSPRCAPAAQAPSASGATICENPQSSHRAKATARLPSVRQVSTLSPSQDVGAGGWEAGGGESAGRTRGLAVIL